MINNLQCTGHTSIAKNYLAQNVNCAEVEKPCLREIMPIFKLGWILASSEAHGSVKKESIHKENCSFLRNKAT